MRTAAEIVEKIREASERPLEFTSDALMGFLTFDESKPLLREGAKADDWGPTLPRERESVLSEMRTYMAEYGWPKALAHRGLSANRTLEKMSAWMWLLGDEPDELLQGVGYTNYGAPSLKVICERYGFDIPVGEAVANMAAGRPCSSSCREGCE